MSEILRTPDERFENLEGYPFAPNYLDVDGLRIHYVDEGSQDAEPVLMLHGEPSWSYLYRKMIPIFVDAGYRAIAPDLVGFGKSDKPSAKEAYTYQNHVDWMRGFLEALDLKNITLVCQDWGSLLGLRLVGEHSERFSRVVLANGGLPTGDQKMPDAFKQWQEFSQTTPVFDVGAIIAMGTKFPLSDDIKMAYDAPFPDESYKEGARMFPMLVPSTPEDPATEANRAAWEVLRGFEKPFLTAFSDEDPITRNGERIFKRYVPGTKDQPHTTIEGAGHFLQEDKGEELAKVVVDWMK
jgi:haloalkane dehalogenase